MKKRELPPPHKMTAQACSPRKAMTPSPGCTSQCCTSRSIEKSERLVLDGVEWSDLQVVWHGSMTGRLTVMVVSGGGEGETVVTKPRSDGGPRLLLLMYRIWIICS
jgi:hypothetical protein